MKRPHNPTNIKEEIDFDVNGRSTPKKRDDDLLKCELCSTVCSSISQLQSHTLSDHIPDRKTSFLSSTTNPTSHRVSCQQCEETFDNFAHFAVHMKSHIGTVSSQIFFCPICPTGTPFRDKKSQIEHITNQHLQTQVTQFVCSACDATFASTQSLCLHFSETHKKLMCAGCEFVTDNEKLFKDHSKVHCRQIVMFGCVACASSYTTHQNLLTHVQLTHDQDNFYSSALSIQAAQSIKPSSKQRVLQCSVCDEKVLGEDGLDDHRLKMHCKIRFSDKCADCQELLLSEGNFVEHCLRHAKDHNHHCPVCRQSLRSDDQIHAHCTYHMSFNKKKLTDGFTSSGSTSPTNANFIFVCPICGEKLDDGFALIEHSKQHS